MKSILFIKRNQQLINEENNRREFFRFLQDEGKTRLREVVENSELGEMLSESLVGIVRDERKFLTGENYRQLFEFAALLNKKWHKKQLRVWYVKHDDYDSDIVNSFNEWSTNTGIDFIVANSVDESDIRMSFESNAGHWSYIGRDAEHSSLIGKATINFDPVNLREINHEKRVGIMLHEVGHALGLVHEHQKDNSPIIWNKEKVYSDCFIWYGWDRTKVDLNIFNTYNSNELFYSKAFDAHSIMLYAIPYGWSANYQINEMNKTLSSIDKTFVKAFYSGVIKKK
jgi:serralysin